MTARDPRTSFASAADGFVELTGQIPADAWEQSALGEWDVRGLVGHASRALSTIESYLGQPATGPLLDGPTAYFSTALPDPERRRQRDRAIAERGRKSGAELGEDPSSAVAALAKRVRALVDATGDDAPVATPSGIMTLASYLPTRTFELAVHGLDLARALGLDVPSTMKSAITASCELAGQLAGQRPDASDLLLLLAGRGDLPAHLSVV